MHKKEPLLPELSHGFQAQPHVSTIIYPQKKKGKNTKMFLHNKVISNSEIGYPFN